MKNVYRVTRPAWATMDKSETVVILVASILLGIYGGWGETLATNLLTLFKVPTASIHRAWPIFDVIAVTLGCLFLIWCYKKLRVGCYPSTFIYCFNLPEASNPSGKSQVVGYCHVKPDRDNGEITAEGASFFWENGSLDPDGAGFNSTLVHGTEENDETICRIRFDINKSDWHKRLYHHGVLEFQLVTNPTAKADTDAYAGYLRSSKKEVDFQDVEVSAKGYAEWFSKGCVSGRSIQDALEENGEMLFAKLNTMLKAAPPPTLWKDEEHMTSNKTNIWGHQIPMPQSVILDQQLDPYIDGYLSSVLALIGLGVAAIKRFKAHAIKTARTNQDDTLVAYERELKAGLIGQKIPHKEDKALTDRAKIIYGEIADFLVGDSLLDIGCGNGLISSLARARFKRIQLLDVVEYVPEALNLPFMLYTEGHPLPTNELFDTVLVLTVLHHSNDPVELLKLAWGATKKRLLIIESVVGVHQVAPPVRYELANLSDDDQIAYAAFVDWFYNRVLHDNIPVPYNFTTVEKWQSVFLQHNMRLAQTTHLGQDIDIGPEYHVLFVLEKG